MLEETGDLWTKHAEGYWIGIPTNGCLASGNLVMGAGLALAAKNKYPQLPSRLGEHVIHQGNTVCFVGELKIFSFPTKYHWTEPGSLDLIEEGCRRLQLLLPFYDPLPFYIPKIGCGLGGLQWFDVKAICDKYLSDDVVALI